MDVSADDTNQPKMAIDDLQLAALLCSKLCHDLVSPAGAVVNGLEVLADEQDPVMRDQVMGLLNQSAAQTSSRLQFFRMAFGSGGSLGESVDAGEVSRVLAGYMRDKKVDLDWRVTIAAMAKPHIRLVLALALIAGEGLIRGGVLTVENLPDSSDGSGNHAGYRVTGRGERLIFQDIIARILTNDAANTDHGLQSGDIQPEPRFAPALLAVRVAAELGWHTSFAQPEENCVVLDVSP